MSQESTELIQDQNTLLAVLVSTFLKDRKIAEKFLEQSSANTPLYMELLAPKFLNYIINNYTQDNLTDDQKAAIAALDLLLKLQKENVPLLRMLLGAGLVLAMTSLNIGFSLAFLLIAGPYLASALPLAASVSLCLGAILLSCAISGVIISKIFDKFILHLSTADEEIRQEKIDTEVKKFIDEDLQPTILGALTMGSFFKGFNSTDTSTQTEKKENEEIKLEK